MTTITLHTESNAIVLEDRKSDNYMECIAIEILFFFRKQLIWFVNFYLAFEQQEMFKQCWLN